MRNVLELNSSEEFSEVSKNFNRMAKRLEDYHASTLSDMMASKKYMEDYHQQYQRAYYRFK